MSLTRLIRLSHTFSRGNFADSFGEDFLGLRELGIADEFGLASLSIPKKLLRGKNKGVKDPGMYVSFYIL